MNKVIKTILLGAILSAPVSVCCAMTIDEAIEAARADILAKYAPPKASDYTSGGTASSSSTPADMAAPGTSKSPASSSSSSSAQPSTQPSQKPSAPSYPYVQQGDVDSSGSDSSGSGTTNYGY